MMMPLHFLRQPGDAPGVQPGVRNTRSQIERLPLRPRWHAQLLWTLAFSLGLILSAQASHAQESPSSLSRWVSDAEMSELSARLPQLRQDVEQLLQITRQTPSDLSQRLAAIASDPARPALQRDALIHGYAMALRQLRASQVDAASLDWLDHYQPQRWRLHEESASYAQPVFDVAAAVAGTRHEWDYQNARQAVAAVQQREQAQQLLSRYQRAEPAYQQGFASAFAQLDSAQLQLWREVLEQQPALSHSPLMGEILLQQEAPSGLAEWLQGSAESTATPLLRRAVAQLHAAQQTPALYQLCADLLKIHSGSLAATCLALANPSLSSAPELRDQWIDLLHQQLSHPDYGAAAAQALAGVLDPAQLQQWQTQSHSALEQQRLRLIQHLQLSATQLKSTAEGSL